ncbi:MAG: CRISPR-associated helicase Cas3' [Spirochaetaceae bacterium]|jgi:CRISPR-associated endonuclease/helicase Cas3|nr:CRISPR-associated helicase Cas3' [Spirochaetaceae bacterium]
MTVYKARYKTTSDEEYQVLADHLTETGMYGEYFAKAIGLSKPALLLGLLHDLGKNLTSWQDYLDEKKLSISITDKQDHASAGGQFLYRRITQDTDDDKELIGQLLGACIMYHHGSGLPDVIKPDGTAKLHERLIKIDIHCDEAMANLEVSIRQRIDQILEDENFIAETIGTLGHLVKIRKNKANQFFNLGLTARFLSSCLIDADRSSSAFYDRGIPPTIEAGMVKADWKALQELLETRLTQFPKTGKLNKIRRDVSARCADYADRESGIYTLTAATGAGKTLAALRYALVHAKKYEKERIFIIAPYTSILDQNADVIRDILDPKGKNGRIVLEHHSNLDRSDVSEYYIDASQTWNVPIIITTMVQFLEALFGCGTQKIRHMHRLTNAVIIFDEVQTLPISCTYLFTWALQYLCQGGNSSALLCTATQPGFDKLDTKYSLQLPVSNEVISDLTKHFEALKRVVLIDKTKPGGWTLDEVAGFIEQLPEKSILTVVNTKPQAQSLYAILFQRHPDWEIVHLSTNMCPTHRRQSIERLKKTLADKSKRCVCISTRLIEAGVDIDFDTAIRFLAGLDSIIQTAGRCNRNGLLMDGQRNLISGKTYIINIVKHEEHIGSLKELKVGQEVTKRILREYHDDTRRFNTTLLHPDLISRYFAYFYEQVSDTNLEYKVFPGRTDTILNLLSLNTESKSEYDGLAESKSGTKIKLLPQFCQSFESAWKAFEVIASDTIGIIVPFEKGQFIINELHSGPNQKRTEELLREAQPYSVNIYYKGLKDLLDLHVIRRIEINRDTEIYTVEREHYDEYIGLRPVIDRSTRLDV